VVKPAHVCTLKFHSFTDLSNINLETYLYEGRDSMTEDIVIQVYDHIDSKVRSTADLAHVHSAVQLARPQTLTSMYMFIMRNLWPIRAARGSTARIRANLVM
jgi:hypothetical protein